MTEAELIAEAISNLGGVIFISAIIIAIFTS